MEVVFVTREPDLCSLFASKLGKSDMLCRIQSDFLSFFLQLQKDCIQSDLLVCDFCEFQHIMVDFQEHLKRLHKPLPVVFYNDPYPCAENRVSYWIGQNEHLYQNEEFHGLIPIFQLLNELIENPSIRPHISLLRPPLPLDGAGESPERDSFDLNRFRIQNRMPPGIFALFEFFYGNLSKEISVKELSRRISGQSSRFAVQRASVYSYVSRLKKYIRGDSASRFDIIRTSSGRYKMVRC